MTMVIFSLPNNRIRLADELVSYPELKCIVLWRMVDLQRNGNGDLTTFYSVTRRMHCHAQFLHISCSYLSFLLLCTDIFQQQQMTLILIGSETIIKSLGEATKSIFNCSLKVLIQLSPPRCTLRVGHLTVQPRRQQEQQHQMGYINVLHFLLVIIMAIVRSFVRATPSSTSLPHYYYLTLACRFC